MVHPHHRRFDGSLPQGTIREVPEKPLAEDEADAGALTGFRDAVL